MIPCLYGTHHASRECTALNYVKYTVLPMCLFQTPPPQKKKRRKKEEE